MNRSCGFESTKVLVNNYAKYQSPKAECMALRFQHGSRRSCPFTTKKGGSKTIRQITAKIGLRPTSSLFQGQLKTIQASFHAITTKISTQSQHCPNRLSKPYLPIYRRTLNPSKASSHKYSLSRSIAPTLIPTRRLYSARRQCHGET